jgi:integrase/recombinase XerD
LPALGNPCSSSVIKKIFKRPQTIQWDIVDKEAVDEIIFRTESVRSRLKLELMARGGMRVGEILNLTPGDIQERTASVLSVGSTLKQMIPRQLTGNQSPFG